VQKLRHRIYEGDFRGDAVNDIDRMGYTRAVQVFYEIGCARGSAYLVYITDLDYVKELLARRIM
jgi:hypothetical protein